jgi:hypothetical protein
MSAQLKPVQSNSNQIPLIYVADDDEATLELIDAFLAATGWRWSVSRAPTG